MTYIELVNIIKNLAEGNPVVNSAYDGDAAYVWNNKDVMYPSVCFSLTSATEDEDNATFTFNFYSGDRQAEDVDSTTENNYQELWDILRRLFIQLDEEGVDVQRPITYYFSNLKMNDVLAVCTAQVSLSVPVDRCLD